MKIAFSLAILLIASSFAQANGSRIRTGRGAKEIRRELERTEKQLKAAPGVRPAGETLVSQSKPLEAREKTEVEIARDRLNDLNRNFDSKHDAFTRMTQDMQLNPEFSSVVRDMLDLTRNSLDPRKSADSQRDVLDVASTIFGLSKRALKLEVKVENGQKAEVENWSPEGLRALLEFMVDLKLEYNNSNNLVEAFKIAAEKRGLSEEQIRLLCKEMFA